MLFQGLSSPSPPLQKNAVRWREIIGLGVHKKFHLDCAAHGVVLLNWAPFGGIENLTVSCNLARSFVHSVRFILSLCAVS